jgi:hypothetical protein
MSTHLASLEGDIAKPGANAKHSGRLGETGLSTDGTGRHHTKFVGVGSSSSGNDGSVSFMVEDLELIQCIER